MADVFISYARSTAKQAQRAAGALRALGYSVWLDDAAPAHRAFARVLQDELDAAMAVLVIWSGDAAKSDWVSSEASRARRAGKLVQLRLEKTPLPMPFDQIQCADLSGWTGEGDHPAWSKVVASVAELTGREANDATRLETATPQPAAEPLLAVLAFDNLSSDPEMDYFSDGVSEEILQTVARSAALKVIGRGSSFQFRGADKAAAHVAAELKATHVLDGSVRRSGTQLRIAAHLIACAGETTLWSNRFDGDLSNIFALQDRVAAAVAAALRIAFAPSAPPAQIDPETYDLYLRAQGAAPDDQASRIRMLEQVTARAPAFASAWAALAWARAFRGRIGSTRGFPESERILAIKEAETALGLDPRAALALAALSYVQPFRHFRERETRLRQALAVAPNAASILVELSSFCSSVGRQQEAFDLVLRARELDPLLPRATARLATCYFEAGDWPKTFEAYEAARKRWPQSDLFIFNELVVCAHHREWVTFDALAEHARAAGSITPRVRAALFFGSVLRDPSPETPSRVLREVRDRLDRSGRVSLDALCTAFELGLHEEVVALIREASFDHLGDPNGAPPSAGNISTIFRKSAEAYRDVRFLELCAKLGLCDYWAQTDRWPDCADDVPYDFRAEARRLAGVHA